jgi:hypothetical protein
VRAREPDVTGYAFLAGFLECFFGKFFIEPHSTKQIEDFVGWGLEIDPATLVATDEGVIPARREPMRPVCERVGGHGVLARDRVMVNLLLEQFVNRIG